MSDEIKKPELVNAEEEKQLDEKDAPKQAEASEDELSKAVGGTRLHNSLGGPEGLLDKGTYSRP
jgi:hypothetical protein